MAPDEIDLTPEMVAASVVGARTTPTSCMTTTDELPADRYVVDSGRQAGLLNALSTWG